MLRRLVTVPLVILCLICGLTLIIPLMYWILTGKDYIMLLPKAVEYSNKPKLEENEELGENGCLCQENAKGKQIMGWCPKHRTDWL